ncbi:SWIB/MDM2 domain-containing protein [Sphingomonas japonica]|uniref:Chromatin remodeling complex protein RSC6 n=1 Tax=Sphingomonas japonica TaxID=511662 RepID=A0ABX0U6B9_9SPHN|nr:SWIB/MDM2 domain-containing protein [Sphingomonas japonica]NIJ24317.1 chromatin remodeling complex protein RSC6 [Sphingomonas japonica]
MTDGSNKVGMEASEGTVTPSPALALILGSADPLPHSAVAGRVWAYIKANNLQDPNDKREIIADPALEAALGKSRVTMFELPGLLDAQLR